MSDLVAIDVAILPPEAVAREAIRLSASLPADSSKGLRLGDIYLPHVTLTQQFVKAAELERALDVVGDALDGLEAPRLDVTGGEASGATVWMAIRRTSELLDLHERLMAVLEPFEQAGGTEGAFTRGGARPRDVSWVGGFRRSSSFGAFRPHITLGHAQAPPLVASVAFTADTIAACHLGQFCTCQRVLRRWTLAGRRPKAEGR